MRIRSQLLFATIFFFLSFGYCQTKPSTIKLYPELTYQTIANFGASDAWSCQVVGNWPDKIREPIAELLFSTSLDKEGNPKGIGLSCWRFNIGAGSWEQGQKSNIKDLWRRAESFIGEKGTFDWNKQSGQQWFLQKAHTYEVKDLVLFSNSPPVHFTKNHKAYSEDGKGANLPPSNYDYYVNFLSDVIFHFNTIGVEIDYISPFNEPQWDWKCCKQEGSPWYNNQISSITKRLNHKLALSNSTTQIEIPESAQINFLYESSKSYSNQSDQIFEFFNPASKNYLGNLSHVAKKVAAHSYFTTWDSTRLMGTRNKLRDAMENYPELTFG